MDLPLCLEESGSLLDPSGTGIPGDAQGMWWDRTRNIRTNPKRLSRRTLARLDCQSTGPVYRHDGPARPLPAVETLAYAGAAPIGRRGG